MNDRHDHDADDDQTQDPVDGHDRRLRFVLLVFLLHLFRIFRSLIFILAYPFLCSFLSGGSRRLTPVHSPACRYVNDQIQHQRQRKRRKHIQNGVLLDEHRSRADCDGNDDCRDAHLFKYLLSNVTARTAMQPTTCILGSTFVGVSAE